MLRGSSLLRLLRTPAAAGARQAAVHHPTPATAMAAARALSDAAAPAHEADPTRRKLLNALTYRAKQRGFLELDLLVGGWAEAHLPRLSASELRSFEAVLAQENPELFKWLTGQLPPSAEMAANGVFLQLRAHVAKFLEENSALATRGRLGKEWVRGWGDDGARLPSSGNQQ